MSLAEKKEDELPRVAQLDALHGWRLAMLNVTDTLLTLKSLGYSNVLTAESDAVCMSGSTDHRNDAPQLGCSCGYYAVKERDSERLSARGMYGYVLLEVDLMGRIIECTNGFRAQHQRIIALWMPGRCQNGFLCEERATKMLFIPSKEKQGWELIFPEQYLSNYQFQQRQGSFAGSASYPAEPPNRSHYYQPVVMPRMMATPIEVKSVCDRHIPAELEQRTATPAKLTSYLGIEVRFETDE